MHKQFKFKHMPVAVSYKYNKAEPMTREYPGCPAEYNISDVYCGDELINDFFDEMDLWDDLTKALVEEVEG